MTKLLRGAGVLFRSCAVSLLRGYLGVAVATTRWTFKIAPQARPYLTGEDGKAAVIVFWHEILPLTPAFWWWAEQQNPILKLKVLISRNRDGRLIADMVAPWGVRSIAGSSDTKGKNKGGAAALRHMRQSLRAGSLIVVTPDGPRGPRRVPQPGAFALARLSGQPVVPAGASCSGFRLGSWDRLLLPLPFGRGVFVVGAPLFFSRETEEAGKATLADSLNTLMHDASCSAPQGEHGYFRPRSFPPSWLWHGVGMCLTPFLPFFLRWRQTRGKELPARVREKMGFATRPRPSGPLLWFHAASVGELVSILPLVLSCLAKNSDVSALVTTGTVTAATMLVQRISDPRVIHQFVPLDTPRWGRRFLEFWRPQVAVFTESELWPGLLGLCRARGIPVVLVNGRMSASSWRTWRRFPSTIKKTLHCLTWISARNPKDAKRFSALGARRIIQGGDLKVAAPALPVDQVQYATLQKRLVGRFVVLAASTHSGEEEQIIQAVQSVRKTHPEVLAIIVPRHPQRGTEVASLLHNAPQRSLGQLPGPEDGVWIADTLGEMGLFFRLADCVFMGNSLPPGKGGGHNPYEPARLNCAIATGPRIENFAEAFSAMCDCITTVQDASELAQWVVDMLTLPQKRQRLAELAKGYVVSEQNLPDMLADRILGLV